MADSQIDCDAIKVQRQIAWVDAMLERSSPYQNTIENRDQQVMVFLADLFMELDALRTKPGSPSNGLLVNAVITFTRAIQVYIDHHFLTLDSLRYAMYIERQAVNLLSELQSSTHQE